MKLDIKGKPSNGKVYGLVDELPDRIDAITWFFPQFIAEMAIMELAGYVGDAPGVESDASHEDRRRYYTLTEEGRVALEAEAARLDHAAALARAQGVLEELEKAHIYIEQLHESIQELNERLGELEAAQGEK